MSRLLSSWSPTNVVWLHFVFPVMSTKSLYSPRFSLLYLRSLSVHKGSGDTGVILRGQDPVIVEAVLPNSAAERAGLLKGDCILKINSQSVV